MNANEIADELDGRLDHQAANMIRQQQEQIDKLTAIVALRELMIEELKVRLKSEFEYVENLLKIQKGETNEL